MKQSSCSIKLTLILKTDRVSDPLLLLADDNKGANVDDYSGDGAEDDHMVQQGLDGANPTRRRRIVNGHPENGKAKAMI